jgi:hypothetical protein
MKLRRGALVAALLTCALALFPSSARAGVTLDLTVSASSPDSGSSINGAIYNQGALLAGTGVFPSFVQVAPGGSATTESGYNTTVNGVLDNGSADTHNFAIQVKDLPIFTVGTTDYYSFFLDINEATGGNPENRFLSLDNLKLYTSDTPNQSVTDPDALGTLRYSMQSPTSGNVVLLDYSFFAGSGKADLEVLVPVSNFAGASPDDFVYLFSSFGAVGVVGSRDYGASDGFEEWALGRSNAGPPQTIPAPASLLLGFAGAGSFGGFAGLSWLRRRLGRK